MNFNFYIFGNPSGNYIQYPDDYFSAIVLNAQSGLEGSRLVIKRELNLFHYIYFERIDEKQYIGLGVIFNNSRIEKPLQLIKLFKYLIEDSIIQKGIFLNYNEDGKIVFSANHFSDNIREINRLHDHIDKEFETHASQYGIKQVSSIYNGTKTSSTISSDAPNAQILALTDKHNTVIIESSDGLEAGYIEKIIAKITTEKEKAIHRVTELESEIARVNKQKKQYGWVAFLSIAVLAAILGLYALNSNLTGVISNKDAEIARLERGVKQRDDTITEVRDSVQSLSAIIVEKNKAIQEGKLALKEADESIGVLNEEISTLKEDVRTKTSQLSEAQAAKQKAESSLSSFKSSFPLSITKVEFANTDYDGNIETSYGSTLYSSRTMYIKPRITYSGINSGKSVTLKMRLYTPNGLSTGDNSPSGFSYSTSIYVSSGSGNTVALTGWGGKTKGHWKSGSYRLEIWYEDVCLKAKSFTIY